MVQPYTRAVSLHLSRTLDDIGLNQVTVGHRRQTYLYEEKVSNVYGLLKGEDKSHFHFGSQTEGTTTPGLASDADTLICDHRYNVIECWSEWKQGKRNLLILRENASPGYCRLQVLRDDIPMERQNFPNSDCTYDDRGRVLLNNTALHVSAAGIKLVRNGPARTHIDPLGFADTDHVLAFCCNTWPAQAGDFTRRQRRYGWPTERLLQQSIKHGVFLVPVGHKLSPTENLEWRISTSLAERCLMFSLSIIHIKCFVVLKILVKEFVESRIRKCISSYHCKTAILYCKENNEPGIWREDNLLQCVQLCLTMLLTWVTNSFCPQFFMPEVNLFAGKVTVKNRDMLIAAFTYLVRSNGRALLCVSTDDLGNKLQTKLSTENSFEPVPDSLATIRLVGEFLCCVNECINQRMNFIFVREKSSTPATAIRSVHQKIAMLSHHVRQVVKHERQAIRTFITRLFCWMGSLLASMALSRKMSVPRESIKLFRAGVKYDVSSMLKLASVFHSSGNLRKAETVLQRVEAHFSRNKIQPVCSCSIEPQNISLEFRHLMFVLKGRMTRAKLFAFCVVFTVQEIHCAPLALRNELYRAKGDDANSRNPAYDMWMDLAVVDCHPYLYFLQYLTYRQLGKLHLQKRALQTLKRCAKEGYNLRHLETAWNLLGQCLELEQNLEAANECYRTSLKIRPRNNAANWHVQNLRYMAIRSGCLKTS